MGNQKSRSNRRDHLPEHTRQEIREKLRVLPKRSIIDYLVQNFFKEVNWIYEMIHPPTFLSQYRSWWQIQPELGFAELEYTVLLLRICAYSAQFLPSRTYTADTIAGVPLGSIRQHCQRVADDIATLCDSLSDSKSLASVQYLFFAACFSKNEGRMKEAWFKLGTAIRLAQDLSLHLESATPSNANLDALEKEMRSRTFWNLYIWDR